ncbi:di-heme oxidoreductase family protein [Enterovibrio calviensis]|uniref:di-heme oxidoreductase family protein n=1 Tax=Enterovibrio calviensis TaxID=91359 RepID=UPI000488741A|nr:di-heme oxidoredictase family protein [Enterovibrio calviensis]
MKYTVLLLSVFASLSFASEIKSGGDTTTSKQGANAFSQPATNLPLSDRIDFSVGNSFFRNPWVSAPASTDARDGLGPLFNTNGCQNCHIKDGRGHLPLEGDQNAVSLLIRLSIPALTDTQKKQLILSGNIPEPTYGGQLQDFALPGEKPEGRIVVKFDYHTETFADGHTVELRKPIISIADLNYGAMHPNTQMSARIAPPMIGLGLLESIPEATLLAIADQQNKDNNGVSGRPNYVWDVAQDKTVVGRFGWKAGQPNLMQQNAAAFNGDLGLTSALFADENCSTGQDLCQRLPNGGNPEVSEKILNFVEFYSQHLAVPMRRNLSDPLVQKGETLFQEAGCASCHQSNLKTAARSNRPALSEQTIHPYTDLLLHDMGEGLADNRGEFLANGQEWRTAPLWGIGYTHEVNGHTEYLHDGRARTEMEAILWHGGEAKASQQAVLGFDARQRAALIAFLKSL